MKHPNRLLATFQILNTFSNLAIVVLCTYVFDQVLSCSENSCSVFVVELLLLGVGILLFGEIAPKMYAQGKALKYARRAAPFLNVLEYLCRPFSGFLLKITRLAHGFF